VYIAVWNMQRIIACFFEWESHTISSQSDHDQAEDDLHEADGVNPRHSHFECVDLMMVVLLVGISKREEQRIKEPVEENSTFCGVLNLSGRRCHQNQLVYTKPRRRTMVYKVAQPSRESGQPLASGQRHR
jgi:hypothetical protein